MKTSEIVSTAISTLSMLALFLSLIAVARSNSKLADSMRLTNLQAMVVEMNQLRRFRATDTEVERSLFEDRVNWTDTQIHHNLVAVQLANIFEWAYLARRDGLIELDVWDSWVETWRSVILASEPLRKAFTPTVWTFGRSKDTLAALTLLVEGTGIISDPLRVQSGLGSRITKKLSRRLQ